MGVTHSRFYHARMGFAHRTRPLLNRITHPLDALQRSSIATTRRVGAPLEGKHAGPTGSNVL